VSFSFQSLVNREAVWPVDNGELTFVRLIT